jgi:hypothetical protein
MGKEAGLVRAGWPDAGMGKTVNGRDEQMILRNQRKPGHFWIDNEVADCYQPIVGADAVWVYCRITRQAYGPWVRFGLREMAELCGKSADTVRRCLAVLEAVGLIGVDRNGKRKGQYALVDVKDLVIRHGGEYDRQAGCYRLPVAETERMQKQVKALRVELARKKSAPSANGIALVTAVTVAQSDRLTAPTFFGSEAKCDRTVAQSDKTVAPGAHASFYMKDTKHQDKEQHPLTPSQARGNGEGEEASDAGKTKDGAAVVAGNCVSAGEDPRGEDETSYREVISGVASGGASGGDGSRAERAVDQVMQGCGLTAHRLRKVLAAQLKQQVDRGELLPTVALAMIAAWKKYILQDTGLRVKWGAKRFFEEGYWREERSWHWDRQALQEKQRAFGI